MQYIITEKQSNQNHTTHNETKAKVHDSQIVSLNLRKPEVEHLFRKGYLCVTQLIDVCEKGTVTFVNKNKI